MSYGQMASICIIIFWMCYYFLKLVPVLAFVFLRFEKYDNVHMFAFLSL